MPGFRVAIYCVVDPDRQNSAIFQSTPSDSRAKAVSHMALYFPRYRFESQSQRGH
jgi:hypothetical protein